MIGQESRCYRIVQTLLLISLLAVMTAAQQSGKVDNGGAAASGNSNGTSRTLQAIVDEAAAETLKRFAARGLQEKHLAITLIDLSEGQTSDTAINTKHVASFRGSVPIYPASVVKLFYLVAAHRELEAGNLKESDELRRAMFDMIVESSNDATHYVLDVVTGTTGGGELPAAAMIDWTQKRNAVNRYFQSLGYTGINVNQKPWCEGPYGRERAFLGAKYENRNKLTTDATARLLADIVRGRAVSKERSAQMMNLLKRDPFAESDDPDDQARGFTGSALPVGAKLWSKAGWTTTARHDAAYIELPNGRRLILVTFTTDHSKERDIIPTVFKAVMSDE